MAFVRSGSRELGVNIAPPVAGSNTKNGPTSFPFSDADNVKLLKKLLGNPHETPPQSASYLTRKSGVGLLRSDPSAGGSSGTNGSGFTGALPICVVPTLVVRGKAGAHAPSRAVPHTPPRWATPP